MVDVRNPSQLVPKGDIVVAYTTYGRFVYIHGIVAKGTMAYAGVIYSPRMGIPEGELVIIDGSDPTAPSIAARLYLGLSCAYLHDIALYDTFALVACQSIHGLPSVPTYSLLVVDVADPQQPRIVSRNWLGAAGASLRVVGRTGYLLLNACRGGGATSDTHADPDH